MSQVHPMQFATPVSSKQDLTHIISTTILNAAILNVTADKVI